MIANPNPVIHSRTINIHRVPGGVQTTQSPEPNRPYVIFAAMLDRTLGDFFDRNIYAATVKMCFEQAYLIAYYRDDRPYKADIIAMNPYINQRMVVRSNKSVLPIEMFYPAADRFRVASSDDFIKQGFARPDLLLTPTTMVIGDVLRYEHIPQFSIPQNRMPLLEERLVRLGLNPARWFCVIVYRDSTYRFRGSTPYRDTSDRPFEAVAHHIIHELGGQVVRIGHPQMRRFDLPRDFIDLSAIEGEFMLHAMAASRARFMMTAQSGPSSLPGMFGVPHILTNGTTISGSCTPIGYMLTRHAFSPDGKRIDVSKLLSKGLWSDDAIRKFMNTPGCRVLENTAEELCAAADFMYERTMDCSGWRPEPPRRHHAPPGQYVAYGPYRRSVNIIEFPELWPKAP